MPYKKKFYGKKSKDKKQDNVISRLVKTVNNQELKAVFQVGAALIPAANTMNYYGLSQIAQSAGASNAVTRIGNKVTVQRILANITIRNISDTVAHTARLLLIRTFSPDRATLPALAVVLSPATPYGLPMISDQVKYNDPKNFIHMDGSVTIIKDFGTIWLDAVLMTAASTGGAAGRHQKTYHINKKCDYAVKYTGAAATTESDGALWFVVIGSSAAAVEVDFGTGTYFTDS